MRREPTTHQTSSRVRRRRRWRRMRILPRGAAKKPRRLRGYPRARQGRVVARSRPCISRALSRPRSTPPRASDERIPLPRSAPLPSSKASVTAQLDEPERSSSSCRRLRPRAARRRDGLPLEAARRGARRPRRRRSARRRRPCACSGSERGRARDALARLRPPAARRDEGDAVDVRAAAALAHPHGGRAGDRREGHEDGCRLSSASSPAASSSATTPPP